MGITTAEPPRPDAHARAPAGPLAVPAPGQVRDQLARILQSRRFAQAERTRRFLQYVVEQALAGKSARLKQYSIATEALGRDAGFDPEADPVVRLEAGKLRRALEIYYLGEGAADPVRISIPKGGYVPVFALAGPAPRAVAVRTEPRGLDARRLVVLRFGTPAEARDCQAMAGFFLDQLTVELARYRDIKVVAPDILLPDAAPAGNPVETAAASEARFVLSGSVRRAGPRLRVTARLHDVEGQAILWSEAWDLDPAQPAQQDATARAAAGAICDVYGVVSHVLSVQSVHAPHLPWTLEDTIHRHRYLARTLTEPVYRLARRDLEIATERAPEHPAVWAGLGHAVFYGNVLGFDDDADWMALVHRHAQRSFELDHKNAFGHVVTALLQLYQQRFDEVFDTCARLEEAAPHAPATQLSLGFFRALAGDWEDGTRGLRDAVAKLVHPPGWAWRVTFLERFRAGDHARALAEANRYHAPEAFTPHLLRAAALAPLGRVEEARAAAAEALRLCPALPAIAGRYFRYLAPCDALARELRAALAQAGLPGR
jgi:TolB-like protein